MNFYTFLLILLTATSYYSFGSKNIELIDCNLPMHQGEVGNPIKVHNNCEDTLFMKDGQVIVGTILKERSKSVRYNKCGDQSNESYKVKKTLIKTIVYADGREVDLGSNDSNIEPDNAVRGGIIFGSLVGIGAIALIIYGAFVLFLGGILVWIVLALSSGA